MKERSLVVERGGKEKTSRKTKRRTLLSLTVERTKRLRLVDLDISQQRR